MVRQCMVCKKVDYPNPGLVFRRFPVNPERRQRWILLLNLGTQHVIKFAQICSDHFDQSDIMNTQITGRRQIRPDAEPLLITSVFTEPLFYSLDSTISDASPKNSFKASDVDFESLFKDPQCHDLPEVTAEQNIAGPSNLMLLKSKQDAVKPLWPSTETSETEIVVNRMGEPEPQSSSSTLSEVGDLKPQGSHQRIKKRKRYIGDLPSSDFSSPEKRRRNLAFVKSWDESLKDFVKSVFILLFVIKYKCCLTSLLFLHLNLTLEKKCLRILLLLMKLSDVVFAFRK